jgi:septum formation protein
MVPHGHSSQRLILASASPRRRDLLTEWGIPYISMIADVDETLRASELCEVQAELLAILKVTTIAAKLTASNWILGADTLVSSQGKVLGKPRDDQHAAEMLRLLSGATVEVATGVALIGHGGACASGHVVTRLQMRPFDNDEIQAYVATGEPMGKAGSFAIQGQGGALIESRDGSYSNVVGLPKALVLELLQSASFPGIPQE